MFKQDIIVIDNFFDDFDLLKDNFIKLPFFKREDYPLESGDNQGNWPGMRTQSLMRVEPFLYCLFLKNYTEKINYTPYFKVHTYLHLRLAEDETKDWIHTDSEFDYSGLVYLSNTNLNSGTTFFDEKDNIVADIKFVQNRFVMFNSKIRHRSTGNHGTTLENGRLTLNAFFEWARR